MQIGQVIISISITKIISRENETHKITGDFIKW